MIVVSLIILSLCIFCLYLKVLKIEKTDILEIKESENGMVIITYKGKEIYNVKPKE